MRSVAAVSLMHSFRSTTPASKYYENYSLQSETLDLTIMQFNDPFNDRICHEILCSRTLNRPSIQMLLAIFIVKFLRVYMYMYDVQYTMSELPIRDIC